MLQKINWPDGKQFAFSVFDDTDLATLENIRPVYTFLADLGLRTTKSVWPIAATETPLVGGATCADRDYLKWLVEMQEQGFEMGFHNATCHTSAREDTIRGLDRFAQLFGSNPKTMAGHVGNDEIIYWGSSRLTGILAFLYEIRSYYGNPQRMRTQPSTGHIEGHPLFWGDICKERIKYVRNFVFANVDTLEACPYMPYHDAARPYVNYWFASSEGPNCESFCRTLSEQNQDRLEERGGACIMYTHFAYGFVENGCLNRRFKNLMQRLATKNGFFAPVSVLLDYILETRGHHELTPRERARLEWKWLRHKIRVGST